ncbi:uncharacterized protein LOC133716671 [Rosa rugosa]|uniref:uncharacterized protein LOC133716671 n=1 Tax=Rosa rugosa TaxID=74645 RepID=UPI002B40AD55|nr:uncharacterized protein LOC133716671 [Rosa rugosa]
MPRWFELNLDRRKEISLKEAVGAMAQVALTDIELAARPQKTDLCVTPEIVALVSRTQAIDAVSMLLMPKPLMSSFECSESRNLQFNLEIFHRQLQLNNRYALILYGEVESMTLRGNQIQSPSVPMTNASIPPLPPTPPHSSSAQPSSSSFPPLLTMEQLQAQNADLHHSIDTLTHHFAAFQSTVLQSILQRSTPPSPSSVSTASSTPTSSHNPQIPFGSFSPATTSWSGLGPSNPPPTYHSPPPHSTPLNTTSSLALSASTTTPLSTPLPVSGPSLSTITSTHQPQFFYPEMPYPYPYPPPLFPYPSPPYPYHPHPFPYPTPLPCPDHTRQPPPPNNHEFRPPKVDLPRFTGDDVVGWLSMAERYLRSHRVPPAEKVATLATHFGPDASMWMSVFELRHPNSSWENFVRAFLEQYGAGSLTDLKSTLSHLQHTASVDDFVNAFKKLACRAPEWGDADLLPIFVGGLRHEIRHDVQALEPQTLNAAQRLARRFEAKLSDARAARPPKPIHWTHSARAIGGPSNSSVLPIRQPNGNNFQNGPAHVCKKPVLAILDCPALCPTEDPSPAIDPSPPEEPPDPIPEIGYPLNSITHTKLGEMMRFQGSLNGSPITIFVDCGSAMNFLNPSIAQRLELPISGISPIHFSSASGHSITPSGLVKNITIQIHYYTFLDSFLLLPVAGCDLLLGAPWLDSLGFVGWHFSEKLMVFTSNGKCHILQGIVNSPMTSPSVAQAEIMGLLPPDQLDLSPIDIGPDSVASVHIKAIQSLLDHFHDLFTPCLGLPPQRPIDHKITLLEGTNPINVRPYRYAHSHKDELEAQVREMLAQGIIRPSTSPFSSPVLLVKKKEGTWRFCVDYRQLNAATVKDRFPIPIVDELLDELHRAHYFSKLDLHSGYHQILMHPEDIAKTAFRTHEGHYEFVVMPFGLSNAPSTFQALMNHIFKPLLQKFVLVFFDDILVYSADLESHIAHLAEVFTILQVNSLKVKLSKCTFGQPTVSYLGHTMSAQGVSMDPTKVQCLLYWPKPTTLKALRGFLGLAGYYRRFIQNFSLITRPLNDMLKVDGFNWSQASEDAFLHLKHAMTTAPVLALPDFSKPFTIAADASGIGIGAVLSQQNHPIAFLSKTLSPKNQLLSVYDKEMLAILFSVEKWRPYVLGRHFTILTNHQTLKHLMDQRITTP